MVVCVRILSLLSSSPVSPTGLHSTLCSWARYSLVALLQARATYMALLGSEPHDFTRPAPKWLDQRTNAPTRGTLPSNRTSRLRVCVAGKQI